MVLTTYPRALPGVPGLIASVASRIITAKLDLSVGESGPHDLAVRDTLHVLQHDRVHRIPRPTPVTIAKRPLCPTNLTE
jgi:hypothetical protein